MNFLLAIFSFVDHVVICCASPMGLWTLQKNIQNHLILGFRVNLGFSVSLGFDGWTIYRCFVGPRFPPTCLLLEVVGTLTFGRGKTKNKKIFAKRWLDKRNIRIICYGVRMTKS
jgi:hypothetical protein